MISSLILLQVRLPSLSHVRDLPAFGPAPRYNINSAGAGKLKSGAQDRKGSRFALARYSRQTQGNPPIQRIHRASFKLRRIREIDPRSSRIHLWTIRPLMDPRAAGTICPGKNPRSQWIVPRIGFIHRNNKLVSGEFYRLSNLRVSLALQRTQRPGILRTNFLQKRIDYFRGSFSGPIDSKYAHKSKRNPAEFADSSVVIQISMNRIMFRLCG